MMAKDLDKLKSIDKVLKNYISDLVLSCFFFFFFFVFFFLFVFFVW